MSTFPYFSSERRGQSSANSDAGIGSSEIDEGLSEEPKLLHGTLRVKICKPEGLNTTGRRFSQDFKEKVGLVVGLGIAKFDTAVGWDVPFHFHCAHMVSKISITIKDNENSIGTKDVPVENILNSQGKKTQVEIFGKYGNPKDLISYLLGDPKHGVENPLKILVKVQYLDVKQDCNWDRGIGSLEFFGLPNAFFPQRKGCKVFLYQDAHVPDSFKPNITLAEGQLYQPKSWEDVFDAINGAKHIIYITGWSIYTEISLIRDCTGPELERGTRLGELLKKKANEGVQVLMLVWDDRTGMMTTHDKETRQYFHHSGVHCVLCCRQPDDDEGLWKKLEMRFKWTHHQKTVVVDSELPYGALGKRGIVSFVGGIDLCDGRYDTPSHSLFRTLDTFHHDDFHQPNFSGPNIIKGGPREPWHDIHARLEGAIAWDVLDNFVQRWRKQGENHIQLKELQGIIVDRFEPIKDDDQETWCVQLFRSIDSGAIFGFPNTPEAAARVGLVNAKNNIIDQSIQAAYISAIRRAKNFIYIESQYFLGSSFAWNSDDIRLEEINSWHLIPKELSLKIVRKIEAGERFTVYVVVPMWPEGIPDDSTTQEILFYQKKTMEMMYKDVIRALQAKGIKEDPRNYLAFFCLGNREEKREGEYDPPERPEQNSDYMRAQDARRFMIYVHSKMMIVDDEYIIVGSANINQRSMDGSRDTEIAIGAYQPYRLATTRDPARGQIYGFRMSLWYEHLGRSEPCFNQPQDEVCIERVNELAEENWVAYSRIAPVSDLPGHLLRYPVGIKEDGAIKQLEGFEFFPDTKARVLGKQSFLSSSAIVPRRGRALSIGVYHAP